MSGEYRSEITQESYKELKCLAFWAKGMGPEFYVIGGWAAWKYHSGLGSRDIDVVFADRRVLDEFLSIYYKNNGYEAYGGPFTNRYRKKIVDKESEVFVEIDAASILEGPPFKEDRKRNIPYRLLEKHSVLWDLGAASVRLPVPELLILQKTKAIRDRGWELDHTAVSPIDSARLRSKIRKDAYDIRGISSVVKNWGVVWSIADDCCCRDLVEDTFRTLRVKGV
jgi:hypothetical protein